MTHPNFVVIDFHAESRFLLVKTLRRKFPECVVHETDDAETAIVTMRARRIDAVITHRTFDVEGVKLVRLLRAADSRVAIIMVSGIDREQQALEAGATSFLPYEEWLRIGSVVEQHLRQRTEAGEAAAESGVA